MSTMPSVITKFIDYYAELENQPPLTLTTIYHLDAELTDPFGQYRGLFAIQNYFSQLLTHVKHCHFAINSLIYDENRFTVTWTMSWSHPRISRGKTLLLEGCSTAEIENELIIRQRDYYDAGEMLYEHLPLLGWAIRQVKRRLHS